MKYMLMVTIMLGSGLPGETRSIAVFDTMDTCIEYLMKAEKGAAALNAADKLEYVCYPFDPGKHRQARNERKR